MDAFLPLLCLLLGVALPVGLGVVLARRVHQQTAAPAAYRSVARRLGLDVDTRGASINGYLPDDGRRLYIGEVMVGHGRERSYEHRAVLTLARPLNLGVAVRKRTGRRWFRRDRGHIIHTGIERFDKQFKLSGDDDDRVRDLLTDVVRAQIEAMAESHANLLVSDHHVRVLLHGPITDPESLNDLIARLTHLADVVVAARAEIEPPARLTPHQDLLDGLAQRHGLTYEPQWPAISGDVGGHRVELVIRREDDGYRAAVTGWLVTPLTLGFRLRRQTEPDGYWSVGQDIQVDDAPFDAAFVLKGYSPDKVRQWLGPVAREQLTALAQVGELVSDDHIVRVSRLALDADTLHAALDGVIATLSALEHRQSR